MDNSETGEKDNKSFKNLDFTFNKNIPIDIEKTYQIVLPKW